MTTDDQPKAAVDLAHEPDFALGGLVVSPSTCRVRTGDHDERVEPRVMEVLVVLARAAGATVTRDALIEACWEGRVVSDDAIARIIAKVRGLARDLDPPPFALETIPKIGFRLIPSGEAASPPRPEATPPPRAPRPAWPRPAVLVLATLCVLVVAMAGWAAWRVVSPGARPINPARLEVLAFEARGPDPGVRRLSVAVGEAFLRVTSSAGMEVAPRIAQPGNGASAADATFRIAGSVDREGDAMVVNAQLLDRRSGLLLWSARLERPVQNLVGFDEEVARSIAGPLQCGLEDRRRFKRPMPAASFALYLNVCDAVARQGNPQRMLDAARRLVLAAPDEATAHAMHAIAQAQVARMTDFAPADRVAELRRSAKASAERAIAIEPETPKAYLALAINEPIGNWAAQERLYRRAQEIDPGLAPGRMPYAQMLREVGRLREALELTRLALQADDPRVPYIFVPEVFLSAQAGELEAARATLARLWRINPQMARGVDMTTALWWENPARVRDKVRRLAAPDHSDAEIACYEGHLAAVATRATAPIRGLPATCADLAPDWRVRMLARQGDVEAAYAEMAKPRLASRSTTMFLFYPEMKAFRRDLRFMPLAMRVGLVDYWMDSGRWPDFCSEPDLPYDCAAAARRLSSGKRQETSARVGPGALDG